MAPRRRREKREERKEKSEERRERREERRAKREERGEKLSGSLGKATWPRKGLDPRGGAAKGRGSWERIRWPDAK